MPDMAITSTSEQPMLAIDHENSGNCDRWQRVQIEGLVLNCRIGIHDHEKHHPQRIRIDIELVRREPENPTEDVYGRVMCYESVIEKVRAIVKGGQFKLVETLAERIADICHVDYPDVTALNVKVSKIEVFSDVAKVGVQLVRNFEREANWCRAGRLTMKRS